MLVPVRPTILKPLSTIQHNRRASSCFASDPPAEETVPAAKHALKPSLEQRGEGSESTVPGNNGRIQAVPFWG